jgi:1-acyl-sn-glycerol-3-phosphate acyltransferase
LPTLVVAATLFAITSPVTLVVALAIDVVRPRRMATTRLWAVAAGYLAGEVIGVSILSAVWIVTGAGLWADARRRVTHVVQAVWVSTLCRIASAIYGWRWEVEGLDVVRPGPVIVLVRHTSLLDTMIPTTFLSRRLGMRLRFVLKKELLRDPCLDLAGNWIPNVFVDRAAADTADALARIEQLAEGMDPDEGALIYPEGTLYSAKKLAAAQRSLVEAGSRHAEAGAALRHTLPPRPGGTLALMRGAEAADIVICAHAGLGGLGKRRDLTSGALVGRRIRVSFRRIDRAQVPTDDEARAAWLFDRWAEVDAWVGGRRGRP